MQLSLECIQSAVRAAYRMTYPLPRYLHLQPTAYISAILWILGFTFGLRSGELVEVFWATQRSSPGEGFSARRMSAR